MQPPEQPSPAEPRATRLRFLPARWRGVAARIAGAGFLFFCVKGLIWLVVFGLIAFGLLEG